jgi:hypothetical protein
MRIPRLPVVDWTDASDGLNGLVRFAERRNLVSARVPSHFKRSLHFQGSVYFSATFFQVPSSYNFYRGMFSPLTLLQTIAWVHDAASCSNGQNGGGDYDILQTNKINTCLGAFAKLRKATISFVISVCPSKWNNSARTGRIFMKFDIWMFFENMSRKFKFHYNIIRMTDSFPPLYICDNISLKSS